MSTHADFPSLESAHRASEQAEAEADFWRERWGELATDYPDCFVAVSQDQVVAVSADLMGILKILETKGLGAEDVSVRFLRTDWNRLVL